MPYQASQRLPGEHASRLGHLEVLKSDLVNRLCESFEARGIDSPKIDNTLWQTYQIDENPLSLIFAVDGSLQPIEENRPPYKALAFVKTALMRLDQFALTRIDKDTPNPFALRDILAECAVYHSTVFPLRNVSIPGLNNYHAIRRIIFDSIGDTSLSKEPLETLKWIAFEKWSGDQKSLPLFECPYCEKTVATLAYDTEEGACPACGGHLYITDMLGFHQIMAADAAPNSLATDYMLVNETLLLFTGIKYFWENKRELLNRCLFVKDGPLSIRAQYSKLVAPIRRFLAFAKRRGVSVFIIGQEKTGAFADHLQLIGPYAPSNSIFIPGDSYIKEYIQQRPSRGAPYGKDTNYGSKVFIKLNAYHQMVLNIPTGEFNPDPVLEDFIGAPEILTTLPTILSNRFEGALLPIELANGIASLSTYPSAQILRLFAESSSAQRQP